MEDLIHKTFSSTEIIDRLGLEKERFRGWVDKGYITPSIKKAEGQGSRHEFNLMDLYSAALFLHLIEDVKTTRNEAASLVKIWRNTIERDAKVVDVAYFHYIIFIRHHGEIVSVSFFPKDAFRVKETKDMIGAVVGFVRSTAIESDWEDAIMINFGQLVKNIRRRIK